MIYSYKIMSSASAAAVLHCVTWRHCS